MLLNEFRRVDHEDKYAVLAFLDKHKDDDRDLYAIETMDDYYELWSVFDETLEDVIAYSEFSDKKEKIIQFDKKQQDMDRYYWKEHPTYIRMCQIADHITACSMMEDWGIRVADDVFNEYDAAVIGVWRYLSSLICKKMNKGLAVVCQSGDMPDDMDDETVKIQNKNIVFDYVQLVSGARTNNMSLLMIRDNLASMLDNDGMMTIAFCEIGKDRCIQKVRQEIALSSVDGDFYAAHNSSDSSIDFIFPDVAGIFHEKDCPIEVPFITID